MTTHRNTNYIQESHILFKNAEFLGYNLADSFHQYAKLFVTEVLQKFEKTKTVSIICGLGGNGVDGVAIAQAFINKRINVKLFIIGRVTAATHPLFKSLIDELSRSKSNYLYIKQDAYADDIMQTDLLIESLVGTGLESEKLNKRFKDVVDRISHFTCPLIAVDIPVPHYSADAVYSINYPKVTNADVISVSYPEELELFCGPGEYYELWEPNTSSHKNKNGKVVILTDAREGDHDQILPYNDYPTNTSFVNIKELSKSKDIDDVLCQIEENIEETDVIACDFSSINMLEVALLEFLLKKYCNKKFVLDAISYRAVDPSLLKDKDITLIIQRDELPKVVGEKRKVSASLLEGDLKRFTMQHNFNVMSVGPKAFLYHFTGATKTVILSPSVSFEQLTRKLLHYTAAYAAKNDSWLALRASVVNV